MTGCRPLPARLTTITAKIAKRKRVLDGIQPNPPPGIGIVTSLVAVAVFLSRDVV